MYRRKSRYYRPARSNRSDLTRRGVLGAAAVVAGAAVAEVLHPHHGHAALAVDKTDAAGRNVLTNANGDIVPARSGGHISPSASHTSSATATSSTTPSGSPAAGHTTTPTGGTPHSAGHPHQPPKVENVQLPLARTRVREQPAYYLDDIVANPPKHAIALTVDDGPDPLYTRKVLRLLDKYHCQASFCVVGANVANYPGLIRDIHRAGHAIVNHSYTHIQPFNTQTQKRIVSEITRTQRAVEKAAKVTPELFRAPGGDWSPFIFRACASYGLTPLDWDVDPDDWQMPGTKKIVRAMLRGRPNDIVLCHDGGGNRSETVKALRKVLPAWRHRGYTTVKLVPAHPPAPAATSKPPKHPVQSSPPPVSISSTPTPSVTPSAQTSVTTSP
jgi:peptidoglycan-N-acetylglucosamine deacetylase